jgi:hypothetical protein
VHKPAGCLSTRPCPAGPARPHPPGCTPLLEDGTLLAAKLVGDGAAGGQVVMSDAARLALLAAAGRGGAARAAVEGGYSLLHMGTHVLVRLGQRNLPAATHNCRAHARQDA